MKKQIRNIEEILECLRLLWSGSVEFADNVLVGANVQNHESAMEGTLISENGRYVRSIPYAAGMLENRLTNNILPKNPYDISVFIKEPNPQLMARVLKTGAGIHLVPLLLQSYAHSERNMIHSKNILLGACGVRDIKQLSESPLLSSGDADTLMPPIVLCCDESKQIALVVKHYNEIIFFLIKKEFVYATKTLQDFLSEVSEPSSKKRYLKKEKYEELLKVFVKKGGSGTLEKFTKEFITYVSINTQSLRILIPGDDKKMTETYVSTGFESIKQLPIAKEFIGYITLLCASNNAAIEQKYTFNDFHRSYKMLYKEKKGGENIFSFEGINLPWNQVFGKSYIVFTQKNGGSILMLKKKYSRKHEHINQKNELGRKTFHLNGFLSVVTENYLQNCISIMLRTVHEYAQDNNIDIDPLYELYSRNMYKTTLLSYLESAHNGAQENGNDFMEDAQKLNLYNETSEKHVKHNEIRMAMLAKYVADGKNTLYFDKHLIDVMTEVGNYAAIQAIPYKSFIVKTEQEIWLPQRAYGVSAKVLSPNFVSDLQYAPPQKFTELLVVIEGGHVFIAMLPENPDFSSRSNLTNYLKKITELTTEMKRALSYDKYFKDFKNTYYENISKDLLRSPQAVEVINRYTEARIGKNSNDFKFFEPITKIIDEIPFMGDSGLFYCHLDVNSGEVVLPVNQARTTFESLVSDTTNLFGKVLRIISNIGSIYVEQSNFRNEYLQYVLEEDVPESPIPVAKKNNISNVRYKSEMLHWAQVPYSNIIHFVPDLKEKNKNGDKVRQKITIWKGSQKYTPVVEHVQRYHTKNGVVWRKKKPFVRNKHLQGSYSEGRGLEIVK